MPREKEITIRLTEAERMMLNESAREAGYKRTARYARDVLIRAARGMGIAPDATGRTGQLLKQEAIKQVGPGTCELCGQECRNPRMLHRDHAKGCPRHDGTKTATGRKTNR